MRQSSIRKAEAKRTARKPSIGEVHTEARVTKAAPKRKGSKLRKLKKGLTEPSAEYAAISEILRVMSESPGDVRPVLGAVAEQAAHLCEAPFAGVLLADGDVLRSGARYSLDGTKRDPAPLPLKRSSIAGRAVLDRVTIHHDDVVPLLETEYPDAVNARVLGHRAVLAVPLLRKGKAYGAIFLFRREPRPFSPDRIGLVETFARQAAIAIENARLFDETQRLFKESEQRAAELAIINSVQQALAGELSLQGVYDAVGDKIREVFHDAFVGIRIYDPKTDLVEYPYLYDLATEKRVAVAPEPLRDSTGFGPHVLRTGETLVINENMQAAVERFGSYQITAGPFEKSLVMVPLLVGGQARGLITILNREREHAFSESDVRLLKTLASSMSVALENARLFSETQRRSREAAALAEVGRDISSTLNLTAVMERIARHARELLHADNSAIFLPDADGITYRPIVATGDVAEKIMATEIREGVGIIGGVLQVGCPELVNDTEGDARTIQIPGTPRQKDERLMVAPLLAGATVKGAMAVWRRGANTFDEADLGFLTGLSRQATIAIENARLFREIEVKSRQLEVVSQHKSEFLANMSHELRTPLNAIIGFSEVLSERMFGEINEKQAEYISDILQSGQHLLSLINDILDLSKIEAGRMELELSEFDLPSTIEQTVMLVRERAVRRGITLGRMIDERLASIRADERKVKQVLLNLLSNALKFTPEGGKIDVRAAVNDGVAEISVTDTGVGISPEDQEAVFEEFKQVGTATKKVEGTGLGLAISRKFIELHGGKIWVTSQIGTGSTFAFTLPLQ